MAESSKEKLLKEVKTEPSSEGSKNTTGKTKDSISTVSAMDEPGHYDDTSMTTTVRNTYQLGPYKRFNVSAVTDILRDVLTTNLLQEKYEVEWARKMTKTLSEVIKARVKELMIPRYKIVVQVILGELNGLGLQNSSRCLWDAANDTFASFSFRNSSLFAVATVYGLYYE